MFSRLFSISAVAVICLTAAAAAQEKPAHFAVAVVLANQEKAPVRVVSLERRFNQPRGGSVPVVTVRNFSEKTVKAVRVVAYQAVPKGCSPNKDVNLYSDRPGSAFQLSDAKNDPMLFIAQLKMEPNGTAQLAQEVAGQAMAMPRLKTRYLQLQIGVERVEFTDGSVWERPKKEQFTLFDEKLMKADAAKCKEWAWIEGLWPEDIFTMTMREPLPDAPPVSGQRYEFFCKMEGKLICTK